MDTRKPHNCANRSADRLFPNEGYCVDRDPLAPNVVSIGLRNSTERHLPNLSTPTLIMMRFPYIAAEEEIASTLLATAKLRRSSRTDSTLLSSVNSTES